MRDIKLCVKIRAFNYNNLPNKKPSDSRKVSQSKNSGFIILLTHFILIHCFDIFYAFLKSMKIVMDMIKTMYNRVSQYNLRTFHKSTTRWESNFNYKISSNRIFYYHIFWKYMTTITIILEILFSFQYENCFHDDDNIIRIRYMLYFLVLYHQYLYFFILSFLFFIFHNYFYL